MQLKSHAKSSSEDTWLCYKVLHYGQVLCKVMMVTFFCTSMQSHPYDQSLVVIKGVTPSSLYSKDVRNPNWLHRARFKDTNHSNNKHSINSASSMRANKKHLSSQTVCVLFFTFSVQVSVWSRGVIYCACSLCKQIKCACVKRVNSLKTQN